MNPFAVIVPVTASILVASAGVAGPPVDADESLRWFTPSARIAQQALEARLLEVPAASSLRSMHDRLASAPHVAGTPGDARVIDALVEAYTALGLEVERHEIEVLLAYPVEAEVEVITTQRIELPDGERTIARVDEVERFALPLREAPVVGDRFAGRDDLLPGWNAYSGSGDVTAGVVYANYGRKQDFETLAEHGVNVAGKVVLARYGGNFRGFKARFAEQAGAAGLLIYTDPDDSGYRRGPAYPEGGWANETYIQRGSLKTLPYPGDALTPFVEAVPGAERLDPDDVDLPRIPVQPIGWGAAEQIMRRMRGAPLPRSLRGAWQGGLPLPYRFTGGPDLKVRLHVEQRREVRATANVLATLPGARHPEQTIVFGCHHDAWTFGAGDPNAGSIVLHEIARTLAAAAAQGWRPDRSIVFANWAAEEYGIIGSTEWVEANRDALARDAVAYVNLDMAAMGPRFGSSSAPLLKTVIADAARVVPQAGDDAGRAVFEAWTGGSDTGPSFGDLGGGSDHVGFAAHVGVPCCSLGAGGGDGVSYHSNYETLDWYRRVVGDDYEPAMMLSRVGAVLASRLAGADIAPLDPRHYAPDLRRHLVALDTRAAALGRSIPTAALHAEIDRLEMAADRHVRAVQEELERGSRSGAAVRRLDRASITLERAWIDEAGLPGRPWHRSLYAATDPDSGYAAWMLPAVRQAVETGDDAAIAEAVERTALAVRRLRDRLEEAVAVN